jgi:hypothetical protein
MLTVKSVGNYPFREDWRWTCDPLASHRPQVMSRPVHAIYCDNGRSF